MKERPILFTGPMVRALLSDSKTQTRRVVKPQPIENNRFVGGAYIPQPKRTMRPFQKNGDIAVGSPYIYECCPYGQPGDRLWVRETTVNVEDHGYQGPVYAESEDGRCVRDHGLSPDPDDATEVEPEDIKLRPSIFMPRPMCRITLEVINVRVERLQDISRGDAMDEGCQFPNMAEGDDPRKWYADLWNSINGPGSWDANPWVWAIEFKRVQP